MTMCYFNMTSDLSNRIELDFQTDVEPMVQDLGQKWNDRKVEIMQEKHNIKNQQVSHDITIRSLEEQKRALRAKSEV